MSPCSHCNDFNHNNWECPLLYKQALSQRQRLINASINPNRKMAGVSSLIHTLSKPMLKHIAAMFSLNYRVSSYCIAYEYRTYPVFDKLKTIKQFQKAILQELMNIHKKSVARPIIHLTKNPSPDRAIEECPICFTRDADVLTNCHHSFCGECTITHLQTQQNKGRDCPMCRQNINTLLYDNKQTFPHNTCRNVNQKLGPFRFQNTNYNPDWAVANATVSIKDKREDDDEENDDDDDDEENDDDDDDEDYEYDASLNDDDDDDDDDDDYEDESTRIQSTGNVIECVNNFLSNNNFNIRAFFVKTRNGVIVSNKKPIEPEKSFHQQCYELRQQGIYIRRNGFRFRRGDFVI